MQKSLELLTQYYRKKSYISCTVTSGLDSLHYLTNAEHPCRTCCSLPQFTDQACQTQNSISYEFCIRHRWSIFLYIITRIYLVSYYLLSLGFLGVFLVRQDKSGKEMYVY